MKTHAPNADFRRPAIGPFGMFMVSIAMVLATVMSSNGILAGEQNESSVKHPAAFIYPEVLTSKDTLLVHGKDTKPVKLKSNTMLIWVDRAPGDRFAHRTEFVLISATDTQVVKGSWWPILNGKDLFRDGKKYQVQLPVMLPPRK